MRRERRETAEAGRK
jgi:hypothetical protein